MKLNIVHIINNNLHNFEYINYTIIFYIIVLYTYYTLYIYLLNKNYIMLLLYFTFFILLYNSYKNFTYIIGLVILIIFRVFNIDTIFNNNSINLVNKFVNVKIENVKIENFELKERIQKKANNKGEELKNDAKNNKPSSNPCKSYIINEVQKAGLNISNNQFNYQDKRKNAQSELDSILAGHHDVEPPIIYRL